MRLWLGLSLCLLAALARAADEDAARPLEIEADRVVLDEAAGVSTYQGQVRAVQGETEILADELRLYREGGRLVRVEAQGRPAQMTRRQADRPPLVARARLIRYLPEARRVVLEGEAELRQGDDRFAGERITYDLAGQRVTAGGGRVKVIISPRTLDGGEGR